MIKYVDTDKLEREEMGIVGEVASFSVSFGAISFPEDKIEHPSYENEYVTRSWKVAYDVTYNFYVKMEEEVFGDGEYRVTRPTTFVACHGTFHNDEFIHIGTVDVPKGSYLTISDPWLFWDEHQHTLDAVVDAMDNDLLAGVFVTDEQVGCCVSTTYDGCYGAVIYLDEGFPVFITVWS